MTHTDLFSRSRGIPLSGIARISFRTVKEFFRRSSSLSCANAARAVQSTTKVRTRIFIFDPFVLRISSGCRARLKQRGNFRMIAFPGKVQRGFPVAGGVVQIGAVSQKEFGDIEAAICRGGEQRRVVSGVAVVGIRAMFQEPLNDGGVAAGDRAGKRVVSRTIGGRGINVGTMSGKILDDFQMSEKSCKGYHRKSVGGKRTGLGGIFFDEFPD